MKIKFVQDVIDKLRKKKKNIKEELPMYSVPYTEPKSTYKVLVCPTGFGHSGSGTLLDYMAEFTNTTVHGGYDPESSGYATQYGNTAICEIDLFRAAGSVLDMERVFNTAGYFQDDLAVKLFLHIAEHFYRKGLVYTDYFWQLTHKFVDKIVDIKLKSPSSFEGLFFLRLLAARRKFKNLHSPLLIDTTSERYIYYLKNLTVKEYRSIAKEYITKFLNSIESKEFLVCDQMLTLSKPETDRLLEYFGDFKQICVYRDPRDVYVTGVTRDDTNWMAKNPQDFVKWFAHRGVPAYVHAKSHPNRMLIRFEDFVLNYDEVSKKINKFIGIDESKHVHKREYFNPDVSRKNIGIYKTYEKQDEIKYIEEHLKEYCYYGDL